MKLSVLKLGATGLVASALIYPLSSAQESFFDRDRYVAVTDRPQPAYDPVPLQAGAFEVRPELELGIGTQSNLFATDQNEIDDVVVIAAPTVRAQSTWSRHQLNLDANVRHREFLDTGSQSTTAYGAGLRGRLDVSSSFDISAGVRANKGFEARTEAGTNRAAVEPVEVNRTGGDLGATYQSGRIRLTASAAFDEYDYEDSETSTGGVLDQDFRDRDQSDFRARAAYAVNRDFALFVEAGQVEREYNSSNTTGALNRDSTGNIVRVGANFELPVLLRGDVAIGTQSFDFDDPSLADIDSTSIDARVQWFVSQLVTLTAAGSQTVEDPGLFATPGADVTSWTVRGDYEARRNLLLFAQANVANYDFEGINRSDDRLTAAVGATYKVNKNIWVETSFRHINQDSNVDEFTDNRLQVALKLHP